MISRRHVQKDWKPYVCISEQCAKLTPVPSFTESSKWETHMWAKHGKDWSRTVYKPPTWICDLDHPGMNEAKTPRFTTDEKLASHVRKSHEDITSDEIQLMVRYNTVSLNRAAGVCPFCCYTIKDDTKPKNAVVTASRIETTIPNITISKGLYDISEESEDSSSESPLRHMGRHVSGHLKTFTMIMIRMLSMPDSGDDSENGESVAFFETNTVSDDDSEYKDWESSGDEADNEQPEPFLDGIKVWHDCPDATIDICFVHGLTGNRDTTWTVREQAVAWPPNLLPIYLPKARLLTFGYDAYAVRKTVASASRLVDHAANLLTDLTNERPPPDASQRRIIFVAHSSGGLVCKEAILQSRDNPEAHLRGIFDSVIGIAFMGTPHGGAWMAHWSKIPAHALGFVKSTNKSILETLETNDQLLESNQLKFWSTVRERHQGGKQLEVTCFFETLPFPGVGIVMSRDSAVLEGYAAVGIHANHSGMVKFGSIEDTGFKTLLGELTRWEKQVPPVPGSQQIVRGVVEVWSVH